MTKITNPNGNKGKEEMGASIMLAKGLGKDPSLEIAVSWGPRKMHNFQPENAISWESRKF